MTTNNKVALLSTQEILGREVAVYGTFENPLFLAKDVAEWIEHSNPRVMIKTVDDDEKVVNNVYTLGGEQESWFLTENGLYEVLMQSRKPIAKQFKRGVKEILQTIRRDGVYAVTTQRFAIPKTLSEALLFAANQAQTIEDQQIQLELQAPKVLFADAIENSEDYPLIAEVAKILRQQGVEIGQNRFFEWLRKSGYLGCKGKYYNQPTQRAMDKELFRISKEAITLPNGKDKVVTTTSLTSKGTAYFVKKILRAPSVLTSLPKLCE
ncbi:MAG: phage antirepressor KilAC domain-containing protein [Rikenellaceae bacterium]